jgi:hypothetical protein
MIKKDQDDPLAFGPEGRERLLKLSQNGVVDDLLAMRKTYVFRQRLWSNTKAGFIVFVAALGSIAGAKPLWDALKGLFK